MIRPIFPLYLSDIGFSTIEIGIVLSIPQFLAIFLRVPLSSKARPMGRTRFLTIAMLLNSVAILLYFLAFNKPIVVGARLLHTLPIAAFGPVAMAYVSIISPRRRRGGIMGMYLTSVGLSVFLGPLITSLLTTWIDLKYVFLAAALPSLLSTFLLFSASNADIEGDSDSTVSYSLVEGLKRLWKNKGFVLICLSALLYSSSMGFMRSFFPLFLKEEYLIGAGLISLLYSLRGLTNVLSRPLSGFLSDRVGVGILVVSGLLISSFTIYIISLAPPLEIVAAMMALFGIGWGIRAVSSINFIGFYLGRDDREVGMAIFYNMFDIGVTIGSMTGGLLLTFLSFNTIFWIYSVIIFIAALITLPLVIKKL